MPRSWGVSGIWIKTAASSIDETKRQSAILNDHSKEEKIMLKKLMEAPAKWRRRTKEERRMLVEAFVFLGMARFAVLCLPFRVLSRSLGTHMEESSRNTDPLEARTARLVGQAVRSAANNTPWASVCLPQAVACQWMLKRRGLAGTLYLGVKIAPDSPKGLLAHAWLRCGSRILTGADGHLQFTVVSSFAVTGRRD